MATVNIPFLVCEGVVAIVALLGNLVVILAFFFDHKVRVLRNYHLLSLSVADFLTAAVGIPLYLWSLVTHNPRHFQMCLFVNSWILVLCAVSISSLVAISADRFLSIVAPMKYRQLMSCKMVSGMILAAWSLGCVVGLMPVMGWNLGRVENNRCVFIEIIDLNFLVFQFFATVLAPLLLLFAMYCKIFCVIRERRKRKEARSGKYRDDPQESIQCRKDIHAAKTIATIIIVFAVSWVPLYTINTVMHFCSTCYIPEVLVLISIWLTHFNSAVNPFLYAIGLREIRAAIVVVMNFFYKKGENKSAGDAMTGNAANDDCLKPSLWDMSITQVNEVTGVLETDL